MTVEIPDAALKAVAASKAIVVMTGAGVSAESGVPTFRDPADEHALWKNHDPMELATPQGFAEDPALVTRWYAWRVGRCSGIEPNPGHLALADLEQRLTRRGGVFTLLTQNIDGLHQAAGSANVHELHGSIRTWRCSDCGKPGDHPTPDLEDYPPRCPCGQPLRPNVVWFGESLPEPALAEAQWRSVSCDVFLSIGTSATVYPAAGFAELALSAGATVIEINREPTPLTEHATVAIHGKSGEVLPELVRRAFPGA